MCAEKMPSTNTIQYLRAREEHYDSIMNFLYDDYFKRETLSRALGCESKPLEEDKDAVEYFVNQLKNGLSYVAIDTSNGNLAGICLNALWEADDQSNNDPEGFDPCYAPLMHFLENLEAGHNLFERHTVEKVFELLFLGVLENYGGLGIAIELVKCSEQSARENGFKVMKTTATSPATRHIFKKLNFSLMSEKKILGYPGLPHAKPEDLCQFFVKEL